MEFKIRETHYSNEGGRTSLELIIPYKRKRRIHVVPFNFSSACGRIPLDNWPTTLGPDNLSVLNLHLLSFRRVKQAFWLNFACRHACKALDRIPSRRANAAVRTGQQKVPEGLIFWYPFDILIQQTVLLIVQRTWRGVCGFFDFSSIHSKDG